MRKVPLLILLQFGLPAGLFADVVTLKDGRQISGLVESGNIEELHIKAGDQSQTIDIHEVQAIQFGVSLLTPSAVPPPLKAAELAPTTPEPVPAQPNRLILSDGTHVAGRWWSIDATNVHFLVNNQLQQYPRHDVLGVIFGNATLPPPPERSTTPPAASAQPPASAPQPAPAPALARSSAAPPAQPPSLTQREDAVANPPEESEPAPDRVPLGVRSADPLIRKAAEAALQFTETLPNYVCQEAVSRYESNSRPASFHVLDVVSTDVVYENGKEDYRNITINGRPANKSVEETGAWSTGEFGTLLIDLFSPVTAADFRPNGEDRIAGITAKLYTLDVKRENSHWILHFGSQTYQPAYRGTIWIDPRTARVLRVELEARDLPSGFPTDHVESAVDYQYVRLGGTQDYLLPVHAETLSCQRGTSFCSKNNIDFRNYHKYTGESNIHFGDVVPNNSSAPAAPQPRQ